MYKDNKQVSSVLISAGVLAIFVWGYLFGYALPNICKSVYSSIETLNHAVLYFGILMAGIAALAILIALIQYIIICTRIGKGKSFCKENVKGMNRIALSLMIASIGVFLFGITLPTDTPFIITVIFASVAVFAVSVLAWAMGKLVAHAVTLKDENDLTI